jgi:alpha-beta hydrolase superfamily lysophospholipase
MNPINVSEFYSKQKTWEEIIRFFPENNRIDNDCSPSETILAWKNGYIHLDQYKNPKARAKIIMLHGVGGNGRILSFMAVPLFKKGFEVICPDLPGYGFTSTSSRNITFQGWIDAVNRLIETETDNDKRPVFLFGFSLGGTLAYHVAAQNKGIKGIIATCLLDQRIRKVRDYSAINKTMSRWGPLFLNAFNTIAPGLMLPMKLVANTGAIVNNPDLLKILLQDKTSSGVSVPIRFLHSIINAKPDLEPENFQHCPIALFHPEKDKWTPVEVSKIFFDRIKGDKELRILENAGHFPLEKPGILQLEKYTEDFIKKYL